MKILKGNELIFKFILINLSTGIAMGMVNLIIPIYALSLNASSTEIGLIKGISGVGDLLVVLPAGLLVDYLGSKKMYYISAVLGSSIIILISYVSNIELLLLIMVFFGMAKTLRTTSLNADFFKNMKTIGMNKGGWYKGSMIGGSALIAPILGGIALAAISFKGYFALASMFLLAPFLIILARTNGGINSPVIRKKIGLEDATNHYMALAKNKSLLSATIIESINGAVFNIFSTFIIVLVIKDLGLSAGVAAMLIAFRGGAMFCTIFLCGQLLRKNNSNMYLFSFILAILTLLVLGMSKDISQIAIASVVLGISSGLMSLITFAQVGNIDGEKGKIAGIFAFGFAIGSIIGPTLGGIIGDAYGVQTIFISFIPIFVALALFIFVSNKDKSNLNTWKT